MIFIIPFIILLLLLLLTRNNIISLIGAIFTGGLVYSNLSNSSIYLFFIDLLPSLFLSIISPSGYLYPLLFLLLVSWIIDMFKDLHVLDSYSNLLYSFFFRNSSNSIDLFILLSPLLFFIDDYLTMFGIKSFFSPLLKNTDQNKKKLSLYSINVSSGGSVLFFFSTWSGIIMNQIKLIQPSISKWQELSPFSIFSISKKYLFFPLIAYIGLLFYAVQKKSDLQMIEYKKNSIVYSIDIFIFLLLPLFIALSFLYTFYFCGYYLADIDVAYVMLEGAFYGGLVILFFLFLYKGISYRYVLRSLFSTLLEYKNTVISLLLCWLFSQVMLLCFKADMIFYMPSYLYLFYPVLYFIISLLIAFILGSEWGTMSIMIPLLLCVSTYHNMPLLLGSIISGVIAGAQLSPLSNTSMTIAAIFELNPLLCYSYRIKYLLFCIGLSCLGYLIIGFF